MSSASLPTPSTEAQWVLPSRGRVGMFSLIAAESAIFTIFVVAYIFYLGKEHFGADSEGRAGTSHFRQHLSPLEQFDDSYGGQGFARRSRSRLQPVVVLTFALGSIFSARRGASGTT